MVTTAPLTTHHVVQQHPGMAPRKKKGVRRVEDASARLSAPEGYASWLDYAVAHIDARSLQNEKGWDPQPDWPENVTTEQIRASAKAELEELRPSARGKLTTTHQLADFSERALARRAAEIAKLTKTATPDESAPMSNLFGSAASGLPRDPDEKQKARAWVGKQGRQKAPRVPASADSLREIAGEILKAPTKAAARRLKQQYLAAFYGSRRPKKRRLDS